MIQTLRTGIDWTIVEPGHFCYAGRYGSAVRTISRVTPQRCYYKVPRFSYASEQYVEKGRVEAVSDDKDALGEVVAILLNIEREFSAEAHAEREAATVAGRAQLDELGQESRDLQKRIHEIYREIRKVEAENREAFTPHLATLDKRYAKIVLADLADHGWKVDVPDFTSVDSEA